MRLPLDRSLASSASSILLGDEADPFSFLGMHEVAGSLIVIVFMPKAAEVAVLRADTGEEVGCLRLVDDTGLFAGIVTGHKAYPYRLRVTAEGAENIVADPYSFPSMLGDLDLYLHAEGTHLRSYERMGAHPCVLDGVAGVSFAIWAPNAKRVSVVGDFNDWDGRRHPMRFHPGAGVWDLFIPGVRAGALYKFEIKSKDRQISLKADPYAFETEFRPRTASVVCDLSPRGEHPRVPSGAPRCDLRAPIAIYEVHLGSWRRVPEEHNRYLTYRELAETLVPYAKDMGFTHLELMPVSEHPFDGSWGYQPTGLFAPTSRFGSPADFRYFVDRCHEAGLGVILDWPAGHFPTDAHGLARFDGTQLYEHADPRQGYHPDWHTLVYNFGRREVTNYLLSNAQFWLSVYDIDGLRADAVASMIYCNYSRKPGEWIPNIHGGIENLEALDFLRRLNETVYREFPSKMTIAEESTAWPMVSRPTYVGGLGFGYKWNMGWMNDTLSYMSKDPIYRKYHHDKLTFGLLYAFTENFILPLSHDEVVHGKGSLLAKMPGDQWQKFANLRAYLAFMYTQPGKKLLFMGAEFGQIDEWTHDRSLDWHLTAQPLHAGLQKLVRDLNFLYRETPSLHERDCEAEGFSWIDCSDADAGVIAYIRRGEKPEDFAVVVCNFTPVVRYGYRIGVPRRVRYEETLNSDSALYGGSNVGNLGAVEAQDHPAHGFAYSLPLTLPPLAALILKPERERW